MSVRGSQVGGSFYPQSCGSCSADPVPRHDLGGPRGSSCRSAGADDMHSPNILSLRRIRIVLGAFMSGVTSCRFQRCGGIVCRAPPVPQTRAATRRPGRPPPAAPHAIGRGE